MSQQPNNPTRLIGFIVFFILLGLTLSKSFYIVRPDQFVVVTKFGEPIDEKRDPGLYFLVPFVNEARYLDNRVQGWDDVGKNTMTSELNPIDFVAFARWQVDPSEDGPTRYYKAVGDSKRAHASMDSIVTGNIQAAVREHKLASIVRDKGRRFEARGALDLKNLFVDYDECKPDVATQIRDVLASVPSADANRANQQNDAAKALRSEIVQNILTTSNKVLQEQFGIIILDLHFKYLNYSPRIQDSIINKIIADRRKDMSSYTEVGKTCTGIIDRTKEQEVGDILGSRDRTVRELEGQAIAQAIAIKAHAFNKSPDFFQFLKTLELYEHGLTQRTDMVLSSDSPILRLMNDEKNFASVPKRVLPGPKPLDLGKQPAPEAPKVEPPAADDTKAEAPKKADPSPKADEEAPQ